MDCQAFRASATVDRIEQFSTKSVPKKCWIDHFPNRFGKFVLKLVARTLCLLAQVARRRNLLESWIAHFRTDFVEKCSIRSTVALSWHAIQFIIFV